MAGHMAKKLEGKCIVWNRTMSKAEKHAAEFGSVCAKNGLADLADANIVVLCLPTSAVDSEVARVLAPSMASGSCIVTCTSGEPNATRRIAAETSKHGVHFLDCPVSGGPAGAQKGSLTCMLGADNDDIAERCLQVVNTFAGKTVRTGAVGSGHAIKAVNNALNVTHLLLAAEGLLALQKLGVAPDVALSVINSSSGRSLQTQERIPKEILTRDFNYGFKLPLMAKDTRIAAGILQEGFPDAELLPAAIKLVQQAAEREPEEADYTRAVCLLEQRAGCELGGTKAFEADK